ncbi:MAG: TIGR03667 family PPOX class F420-dependent oxidoreductase [Anaerolineaceae bacterium]|nr:TIGR03667 family PPOX class F420-dependent oxidoreductase [Anaerolineaceae bacterium]MCB9097921.1 TIGR03667 family PPOX class F420-dependent oxidoreductase [Anaerolineales bacterium]
MIDWDNDLGQRTLARIGSEEVIWLTTISPSGFPQPRPVWFVWDGHTFLIYSMPTAKKIRHISQTPQVALHFNTNTDGEDIQVILGDAYIDASAPPTKQNIAYSEKYGAGILALGMTEETYSATFSVALRVVPSRLRGLEPLPEL